MRNSGCGVDTRGLFLLAVLCLSVVVSIPTSSYAAVRSNIPFTSVSLNAGLVGWWTLDGKDMTSNVRDLSGQGNNGHLVNFTATTTAKGVSGQAIVTDGSTNYVQIDNTVYSPTAGTVSLWVKGAVSNAGTPIGSFNNGTSRSPTFTLTSSDIIWEYGNLTSQHSGITATPQKWFHLVMSYDSSFKVNVYINGVRVAADVQGADPGTLYNQIHLGHYANFGSFFFNGTIDDVRIYNRVLSATEIAQYYRASQGGHENTSTSQPNLKSGLVGWWTFDGKDTVQNVRDLSGQGNNGMLAGTIPTTTVRGKIGQALSFSTAAQQYVTMGDQSVLQPGNGDFSVSVWFKTVSTQFSSMVVKRINGAPFYNYAVGIGGVDSCGGSVANQGSVYFFSKSNNNLATEYRTNNTSYADGKWHHAVANYTAGGTVAFYVDGVAASATRNCSQGALGAISPTANFTIGWDSGSTYFDGALDDVRVYNRVLSATEVTQLYKLGEPVHFSKTISQPNLKSGLVGHWTFDGKDMTQNVRDATGRGNNGSLSSGFSTTTVKGKIGQAMRFSASQYIDINTSNINFVWPPGAISVCAWVNLASTSIMGIIAAEDDMTNSPFFLQSQNGYMVFASYQEGSGSTFGAISSVSTKLNTWEHWCGTEDVNSSTKIYKNGQIDSGVAQLDGDGWGVGSTPQYLNLGMRYRSGVYKMNGLLDDVRVYNRILSAAEIKQLYKLGI